LVVQLIGPGVTHAQHELHAKDTNTVNKTKIKSTTAVKIRIQATTTTTATKNRNHLQRHRKYIQHEMQMK